MFCLSRSFRISVIRPGVSTVSMIITDHILSIICPHEISSLLASQMSGRFLNQSRRLRRKPYKGRYLLHPPFLPSWKWIFQDIQWWMKFVGSWRYTLFTTKSPRTRGRKELIIFSFHLHVPYLPIGLTCYHLWHLRWLGFQRSRRCSNNTCEGLWRADCEGCLSLGRPTSRCLDGAQLLCLTRLTQGKLNIGDQIAEGTASDLKLALTQIFLWYRPLDTVAFVYYSLMFFCCLQHLSIKRNNLKYLEPCWFRPHVMDCLL